MGSIHFKMSFLGTIMLLFFAGGSPLFGHAGTHKENPLDLDIAGQPLRFEEVSTMNLDEEPVKLSDYQGKIIFLNFWATWCVPCVEEMPEMQRLADQLIDRPFKIVTLNLQESPEKIKKFYQSLRVKFDTLLDPQGDFFKLYGALQLPTTYIIDKRGFIIARAIGKRQWDSQESIEYFEHLLEKISEIQ